MGMFNLTKEQIDQFGATHTAAEIYQQPAVWEKVLQDFTANQRQYEAFLTSIYEKHGQVRVIFSGAGTSAFVGDALAPALTKVNDKNVSFESIATTNIVSNPTSYFRADTPTILVSFARSGNSPESVATVELGQKIVQDFYQVIITCNEEGQLAKNVQGDDKSIVLLMPAESNDQSLAMTSSFSCMFTAAYALFASHTNVADDVSITIQHGHQFVDLVGDIADEVLRFDFDRLVYLGSGGLGQLAHEAALKMLELSSGQVAAFHETSLGFRHGPKSFLHDTSLVVLFVSKDPYTRQYDIDILRELAAAKSGMKIVALVEEHCDEVAKLADWQIAVNVAGESIENDTYLALLYIIFGQVLAMKKSIQLGMTPDNPSPDGAISRVVKGVTIYDY